MPQFTRDQLVELLQTAADLGVSHALSMVTDRASEDEEGRIDALRALDEDGTGQDREGLYIAGCGEYDTVDYRGRPLRPQYNDAGERMW